MRRVLSNHTTDHSGALSALRHQSKRVWPVGDTGPREVKSAEGKPCWLALGDAPGPHAAQAGGGMRLRPGSPPRRGG